MPLSMTTDIKAADISYLSEGKAGKIFYVTGFDGNDLVIKFDAVDQSNVKNSNKVMKVIDPSVKMKVLTPSERFELYSYASGVAELDAYYQELGNLINGAKEKAKLASKLKDHEEQKAAAASLMDRIKMSHKDDGVVKMNKIIKAQHIEDAISQRDGGSKDLVRSFVKTLKAAGGLEALGRIVAGDLFNGNVDRFSPNEPPQIKKVGTNEYNLRVTANLGNVFIAGEGDSLTISALDFVYPLSMSRNWNRPISGDELAMWTGQYLKDKTKRKKFAELIVQDLEGFFNPNKSRFSFISKLGMGAASRLDKGMVEGARGIKKSLQSKGASMPGLKQLLDEIAMI